MTIGEYYRAMGLKVLILADSTSRWAQALREMSNRLEELPGQDAFPMDLSAVISNFTPVPDWCTCATVRRVR